MLRASCKIVCVITMLIASNGNARAQGMLIGPFVGYEYGVPLTVNRTDGRVNVYQFSGTGQSSNHTAWFGASRELTNLLFDGTSLAPRISLALSTGLTIGALSATTAAEYITIDTGAHWEEQVEPLTFYNVVGANGEFNDGASGSSNRMRFISKSTRRLRR